MTPDGEVEEGELLANCGQKRFWFFEGESVGTKDAWKALAVKATKRNSSAQSTKTRSNIAIFPDLHLRRQKSWRRNGQGRFRSCLAKNKDAPGLRPSIRCKTKAREGHTSPTQAGTIAGKMRHKMACKGKIYREQIKGNTATMKL